MKQSISKIKKQPSKVDLEELLRLVFLVCSGKP